VEEEGGGQEEEEKEEEDIIYTVKPRFNVPTFSEIPDLVMIFSCPDICCI
jgi:hypothetical protein